jgi:hypothetical protein
MLIPEAVTGGLVLTDALGVTNKNDFTEYNTALNGINSFS